MNANIYVNSWGISRKKRNKLMHSINGNGTDIVGYIPYDSQKHKGYSNMTFFFCQK